MAGTGFGLVADIRNGNRGSADWELPAPASHPFSSGIVPAIIGATVGARALAYSETGLLGRAMVKPSATKLDGTGSPTR